MARINVETTSNGIVILSILDSVSGQGIQVPMKPAEAAQLGRALLSSADRVKAPPTGVILPHPALTREEP